MVWQDKFIKINQYSRPAQKLKEVKKIVIHWTANYGASALNHFNYFNNLTGRYASAHIFVDKNEALCIIPLTEIAYHANDGTYRGVEELKPNANFLSIGVEMCVETDGSFHPDTIARTESVMVELCKKYNLNPLTDIVRHYDITRKNCPAPWVVNKKPFEEFKSRINLKLNPPSKVILDTVKNGDGSMKLELNSSQLTQLETVCRHARQAGLLSDFSWEEKAKSGELTVSEAIYLALILDHRRYAEQNKAIEELRNK